MQYKTIVLELLQARPEMYERLRKERKTLSTMNRYAGELKTRHEAWKSQLAQNRPGSEPSQIASEALEMALRDLEERLPAESPPSADFPSIEGAMEFIRRHTPPA